MSTMFVRSLRPPALVALTACIMPNPRVADRTDCGNAILDADEACDLGAQNGDHALCTPTCELAICGDGLVGPGEGCDDGNSDDTDCSSACVPSTCGNGLVNPAELCDDGNADNTDGCTNACALPTCGDGFAQAQEDCDDGNLSFLDACLPSCVVARCGDGIQHIGAEDCDDGNAFDADGCDADCSVSLVSKLVSSAEANHTCALFDTGVASCWGHNSSFQLGLEHHDNIGDDEHPIGRVELEHAITDICVGSNHTCAVMENGSVRCWGDGLSGQLGYGDTSVVRASEAGPVDANGEAKQVFCAGDHTCVIHADSRTSVTCWGANSFGQLGLASTDWIGNDETPGPTTPVGGVPSTLALGPGHSCALVSGQFLVCWGKNQAGQLGLGHEIRIGDDEFAFPAGKAPLLEGASAVGTAGMQPAFVDALALGVSSTCIVRSFGELQCWGRGGQQILGLGVTENLGDEPDEVPAVLAFVELGARARGVVIGAEHACALTQAGTVLCWGSDDHGQLGYPTANSNIPPATQGPVELGGPVEVLAAGAYHTCALRRDQAVVCWGRNQLGQLGLGHTQTVGKDESPIESGLMRLFEDAGVDP